MVASKSNFGLQCLDDDIMTVMQPFSVFPSLSGLSMLVIGQQ